MSNAKEIILQFMEEYKTTDVDWISDQLKIHPSTVYSVLITAGHTPVVKGKRVCQSKVVNHLTKRPIEADGGWSLPKTTSMKALKKRRKDRKEGEYVDGAYWKKQLAREFDQDMKVLKEFEDERPKTRADCVDGPRPCPWVSCKYHTYLEVSDTGSLKVLYNDRPPWELEESCVLDVAERGSLTLEQVGDVLNTTRERIRQVETSALERAVDSSTPKETQAVKDTLDEVPFRVPTRGTEW